MLEAEKSLSLPGRRKQAAVTGGSSLLCAMLLLVVGGMGAGCSKTNTAASAPAVGAAKGPSDVAPGAAKPTPEQEAAKQRAIQQGPAIEAANEAARAAAANGGK